MVIQRHSWTETPITAVKLPFSLKSRYASIRQPSTPPSCRPWCFVIKWVCWPAGSRGGMSASRRWPCCPCWRGWAQPRPASCSSAWSTLLPSAPSCRSWRGRPIIQVGLPHAWLDAFTGTHKHYDYLFVLHTALFSISNFTLLIIKEWTAKLETKQPKADFVLLDLFRHISEIWELPAVITEEWCIFSTYRAGIHWCSSYHSHCDSLAVSGQVFHLFKTKCVFSIVPL